MNHPAAVLPYSPNPKFDRWILKLHGTLSRPEDIVLTRDDYMSYAERRAALSGLVQGLLITKHMLFVGFSLADENFHRIVHDVRKAIEPHSDTGRFAGFGTAVMLDDDQFKRELWEGDLHFATTAVRGAGDAERAAARRLEIFLDRLLLETATTSGHLLDDAYRDLLTDDERRLSDAFAAFLREHGEVGRRVPAAWSRIEEAASDLGQPSKTPVRDGAGPSRRR